MQKNEDTCVDVERLEDICDTVYNGSDRIPWWLEYCKRDHDYNLTTRDLTWEPPLDMKNLGFVYVSNEDSNTRDGKEEISSRLQHVAVFDGLSGDVNPMQIHNEHLSGSKLTAYSSAIKETKVISTEACHNAVLVFWI